MEVDTVHDLILYIYNSFEMLGWKALEVFNDMYL